MDEKGNFRHAEKRGASLLLPLKKRGLAEFRVEAFVANPSGKFDRRLRYRGGQACQKAIKHHNEEEPKRERRRREGTETFPFEEELDWNLFLLRKKNVERKTSSGVFLGERQRRWGVGGKLRALFETKFATKKRLKKNEEGSLPSKTSR